MADKRTGPGRPRLDDDEARSETVRFRVRPDEADEIDEKSTKAKMTISQWIRWRLLGVRK